MGRPHTGAATVYASPRLELSRLRAAGYFAEDAEARGVWTWTNGDSVGLTTVNKGGEVYMELSYTWTDPHTGQAEEVRQRIDVVSKPSNLGKGTVPYFRCPSTGRLCRILYRAYHARTFRCRWGFSYRLYYPAQLSGTRDRANARYWDIERHLEGMKGKRKPGTFRGKPTKRGKRRTRLIHEQARADDLRLSFMLLPKRLRHLIADIL